MKTSINLIPQSLSRELMLRRRLKQWGKAIAVILGMVGFTYWTEWQIYRELSSELIAVELEYTPAQSAFQDVVRLRAQLEKLAVQQAVLGELDRQRHVVTLLGTISEGAASCDGKIQVSKMDVTELQYSPTVGQAADGSAGRLVLTGVALDGIAATQFLSNLESSGLFATVALYKLEDQRKQEFSLNTYEIHCHL
jgi:hypothetical protein